MKKRSRARCLGTHRSRRKRSSGYVSLGVLMAVAALAVVVTVGFNSRSRDLSFEARSLRRHQARWAAESALARARARRAKNQRSEVSGTLPPHLVCDEVGYRSSEDIAGTIRAQGWCRRDGRRDVRAVIRVKLTGRGRGRIVSWQEGH